VRIVCHNLRPFEVGTNAGGGVCVYAVLETDEEVKLFGDKYDTVGSVVRIDQTITKIIDGVPIYGGPSEKWKRLEQYIRSKYDLDFYEWVEVSRFINEHKAEVEYLEKLLNSLPSEHEWRELMKDAIPGNDNFLVIANGKWKVFSIPKGSKVGFYSFSMKLPDDRPATLNDVIEHIKLEIKHQKRMAQDLEKYLQSKRKSV